jgi:hypothetical protein
MRLVRLQLVTIMMGYNDFCIGHCLNDDSIAKIIQDHRQHLNYVLTYLKNNLPRTLVNLVSAPGMMNILTQIRSIVLVLFFRQFLH